MPKVHTFRKQTQFNRAYMRKFNDGQIRHQTHHVQLAQTVEHQTVNFGFLVRAPEVSGAFYFFTLAAL